VTSRIKVPQPSRICERTLVSCLRPEVLARGGNVFAGLRPLVKNDEESNTATLSRDHSLLISPSGLVTITGGKWTTYRKMGQDTVDQAALVACLDERESKTATLRIHGWQEHVDRDDPLHYYGADASALHQLKKDKPALAEKLHRNLPYTKAQVVWAARHEMACTVEDVLARRTRALLLDARASIEAAPEVAELMAKELGKSRSWRKEQAAAYTELARHYLIS